MNVENCKYDFTSDNINIIMLLYDTSGSMYDNEGAIRRANSAFYKDFSKFEERGSIAISKSLFDHHVCLYPFDDIKNFSTSYCTGGGTALYDAIIETAKFMKDYYNEIVKRLNARAKITLLVFTDGYDESSSSSAKDAFKAIKELNSLDATTVFVAFDQAIKAKTGDKLGFTCTKDINTVEELVSCLGIELSKSCKEQSRSVYSLKSEFFSKASADSGDDALDEQAIVDDDFFNV